MSRTLRVSRERIRCIGCKKKELARRRGTRSLFGRARLHLRGATHPHHCWLCLPVYTLLGPIHPHRCLCAKVGEHDS